jgi:hypothetical protein
MRYLTVLIALLCIGCTTPARSPSPARASGVASTSTAEISGEAAAVQRDVEGIVRAIYRGDVDTVMHSTHPNVIRLMGGPDVARKSLDAICAQVAKSGMTLESFSFPEAPRFFAAGGTRYVYVPTRSVVSMNGKRFESLNFQLGVLDPGASHWTYLEGSRLNPQNIQRLLPGFPDDQPFPPIHRKAL